VTARSGGAIVALYLLLAVNQAMAIEEPRYAMVERDGAFEVRQYAAHLVAETVVDADFEKAGSVAFQRLFRYISGENTSRQKIAMTAPVTQAKAPGAGEKIAMTAPVVQQRAKRGYRVAFVVPASYTIDTVPQPNDPLVTIRAIPGQLVAVWRYSGRWTTANYAEHEALLRSTLPKRGLVAQGEPILARYNPPFTPPFLRRNEIQIPVLPSSSSKP
jgi:DNA gyrase inhibitor GyrI